MSKFSFDALVQKLRETPKGKEASMYGPIRDIFIHILGYPAVDVDIDTTGEGGRPDITVRAPSGLLDSKGRPEKIAWLVVEAKDEHSYFVDTGSREIIFADKSKYVGLHTAWFVMIEPTAWVLRPVAGNTLSPDADILIPLDIGSEAEFRRKTEPLNAAKAGVSEQLKRFRAGDIRMIAVEKLESDLTTTASKREINRIRLNRKRFFQQVREATGHLQVSVAGALSRLNAELERYRTLGDAFWAEYGHGPTPFDPHSLTIHGAPKGPTQSRKHDRDAAHLRREFSKSPHMARLALRGLPDFQSRTGIEDSKLKELFAIETANLILARVLLLRFFEDHDFFGEIRYLCNGGVEAFQHMRDYFKSSYTKLLKDAYAEGSRLYSSAFDETELDWVLGVSDEQLSGSIEWTLFQFARYDFKTVKGDILTGIYDRFMDRNQRKKFGEFYTPPSIARYIIRRIGVTSTSRILDPACGSGTFLIESYRQMVGRDVDRGVAEYSDVLEALSRIAGNDLNTFSATLAQIQLLWQILGLKKDIEAHGFPDVLVTAKVNSLVERDQWGALDRFAEIDQPEYDAVIGNPPYVRAERSAQALDVRSQKEFERGRDSFPGISSRLNAYALFLYRALDRWCKPLSEDGTVGKVGFVLPVSLFDNNETAQLRKLFALGGRWAIREIVDLEVIYRDVFDADVLPAILIVENRPAKEDDFVSIRYADRSTVRHHVGDALKDFALDKLPESIVPYTSLFSPDGRILTRLTPARLDILHKLWGNQTFSDVAKPYWVRKERSNVIEWVDQEPAILNEWEARRMIAGGIAFRGSKVQCENGIDVYKGENIIACELQGVAVLPSADFGRIDDASLWRYTSIHPTRGLAVAQVAHCPNGVLFDPRKEAFTNTATLLFPRDEFTAVPFDLLLMSNIYIWFYALAARMGILRTLRSHIYPTNLACLPWNEAIAGRADDIEAMRAPVIHASRSCLAAQESLTESLAALDLATLKARLRSDFDARLTWGNNFGDDTDYKVTISNPTIGEIKEGGWPVQLSDDLFDFVACNQKGIAIGLLIALRQQEGNSLTRSTLLNLPVPVTEDEITRWNVVVDNHQQEKLQRAMDDAIHALDSIVGECLGLTPADITEIHRDRSADPFLRGIAPRYPGTVTRKMGFRNGLDSEERYD